MVYAFDVSRGLFGTALRRRASSFQSPMAALIASSADEVNLYRGSRKLAHDIGILCSALFDGFALDPFVAKDELGNRQPQQKSELALQ